MVDIDSILTEEDYLSLQEIWKICKELDIEVIYMAVNQDHVHYVCFFIVYKVYIFIYMKSINKYLKRKNSDF